MKWPTFSLLFFASQPAEAEQGKFDLFRQSTRFADEHGFEAVWIPERHFHAFGGMFPNPSLAAVVLAETTQRIRLRAGSVVMPLHHPIRVAEEWAVVDNLSNGRVDLSFAIGWNPNDFVIAPHQYAERKRITFEGIEAVRRLWEGEECRRPTATAKPRKSRFTPAPAKASEHLVHLLGREGTICRDGREGIQHSHGAALPERRGIGGESRGVSQGSRRAWACRTGNCHLDAAHVCRDR
jgi:natural product biosynthesis luciferase-like monooxygenase protein